MKMNKKEEWLEVQVPNKWENISLETVLTNKWQVPRGLLHELRMNKGVTLDSNIVSWNTALQTGQRLLIHLYKPESDNLIPEYMDVELVYEDDHLLIANKPPNYGYPSGRTPDKREL